MAPLTQTLRVGFDVRWYNDSGVGTYVTGLLKAMASTGEIQLVVYENPGNAVPGLDDLPITRIPVHSSRYSLSAQWEFRRRAREDSLYLFHSPFYAVPFALSCPVIVTIHDLIPFLFCIDPWPKQQMIKAGYRLAARRARRIICVSRNTAADVERLLHLPPERIAVVHNAAQSCFHSQAADGELDCLGRQYGVRPPYVLATSARNWHTKNLEGALRALQSLGRLTGTKFQTVIYGPPDGFLSLRGRHKDKKENWHDLDLLQTGPVPQSIMAALFRHAIAFIMPSLCEGFGLPVLEAMSCGCPVVTSNRSSLPEVAAGGAQLFDPSDYAGMGRALAALMLDPAERQHWKDKALARAAAFSWEKAAQQTIAAYRAALAGA